MNLRYSDTAIFTHLKNFFSFFGNIAWPSSYQWTQFFKVVSKRERNLFFVFLFFTIASLVFIGARYYLGNTEVAPAKGGSYTEGIIGSPRYLNPILAQTNDADRDIVRIIFASLLKYDGQGNLINDLAESYTIGNNGKIYEVKIKQNAFWHDGQKLTSDDVVFTIKAIQQPEYQSPLRINWQGVEVEKIDDLNVRFKLKNAYAPFLYNLTFGVLPKHIWQDVATTDFHLSEQNLKPIGSGPYVFKKLERNKDGLIKIIELEAFNKYHNDGPYLKNINLKFYPDEESAIDAWQKSEIQGINFISPKNQSRIKNQQTGLNIYSLTLPRYFALFINQTQNKALADKNVRQALAHAIDKDSLLTEVLDGAGKKVDSPVLEGMIGYSDQTKIYEFDLEKAKNILDEAGWKDANNDGFREKAETNLEFSLVTIPWTEFSQTADLLKKNWEAIGAKVSIETKDATSLQQENIRPRQYQMLLFGELLNIDPDPFSFWHSTQTKDPGLNLALYENAQVDAILQDARQDLDPVSRANKYQQFSQIITEDLPAIFLYTPDYLYPILNKFKGVDLKILVMPSDRFSQIEKWYSETARVWK
ncbi:MAG: hypothetical protein HY764_00310 [Candidatus Portnoybacteria bacterium]|nr:hypothetical protein [Candidatus Portnoybacteria bacterium]